MTDFLGLVISDVLVPAEFKNRNFLTTNPKGVAYGQHLKPADGKAVPSVFVPRKRLRPRNCVNVVGCEATYNLYRKSGVFAFFGNDLDW